MPCRAMAHLEQVTYTADADGQLSMWVVVDMADTRAVSLML